jgi:hypothetical protein
MTSQLAIRLRDDLIRRLDELVPEPTRRALRLSGGRSNYISIGWLGSMTRSSTNACHLPTPNSPWPTIPKYGVTHLRGKGRGAVGDYGRRRPARARTHARPCRRQSRERSWSLSAHELCVGLLASYGSGRRTVCLSLAWQRSTTCTRCVGRRSDSGSRVLSDTRMADACTVLSSALGCV